MIRQIKEMINQIVVCLEMDERVAAMQSITEFTLLFSRFLEDNSEYLFDYEITSLNQCIHQNVGVYGTGG